MSTETALAFINKVLLKLQKDSNKKHTKLRDTLKVALDSLKEPGLRGDESVVITLPVWEKLLNALINALKAAVETKSHKFATKTLDCLYRLVANGLVPGSIVDEEAPPRLLLEKLVEVVRLCSDTSDDTTLTQTVKLIQSISSSNVCGLHGIAMKNAFRVVYKIHVNSKSQTQLSTLSRTALLQVLNAPFRVLRTTQSVTKFNKSPLDAVSVGPPPVELEISTSEIELEDSSIINTPPTPTPVDSAIALNGNGNEDGEHNNSSASSTPREEREEPDFPINTKEAHKTPPHLDTISMPPTPKGHDKAPLTVSSEGTLVGDELMALNDCLLLFNHLCKLTAAAFDAELEVTSESQDTRNKYLALELLLNVLESSGPSFRNYERFIHEGLREHLSVVLMVNGNSPHPKIYKLVLSIFLHVLSYFRDFMKDEIEEFVTKILLRSLEVACMMQQRWMSLQVLLQVCKNPQLLLDIFINYDCDLGMKDIFERIVNDLSKVSQGNFQTDHKTSPLQDAQVKLLALEALVALLQSMVEWSHPLYEESQKMSLQSAHGEDPTDYVTEPGAAPTSPTTMRELVQQPDQFSKQKQFKLTIEKGKPKFAISAKKGVQYFLQIGVIKHHPEEVALFFKNTAGLDKAKIGEYIGEKEDFNLEVMQCFVNLFNFAKCDIDIALRQFLSGFRLPGEAQKIDRIMEKFAQRYYITNSDTGTFASAESAYLLAFAIVLLATDLHSSQIKKHITKEEWIKMNRGNNAKQNFDDNYLLGIYDRIGAERLKLHAEGDGADDSREFTPKSSQELRAYHSARNINHVKSMFSTAWHAVLAAFSVLLDQTDDMKVVGLVLTGMKHAVRVSGIFSMDLERSAFITSLSKFTVLDSLRDMKQKHIEAIQALLYIAQADGNYIVDSWTQVQRCISFLDKIHVYGVTTLEDASNAKLDKDRDRASRFLRNQKSEGFSLDLVAHQIDGAIIDKLYAKSNLLSSSAVLALIKSVCEVSLEEVYSAPPSLFSLQKLADIVYLNLYRVRPVWTKIWAIVADYFVRVGTNETLRTSMFAIETLRGIVIKVLEQEDLSSYSFQKELIRPFEQIFSANLTKEVQELILQSFSQIIMSRGNNISSGWKSIFGVFNTAAAEEGSIMCLAFELIEEVLREYFHCIADVFFVDCVNSFSAFANNKSNRDVSLRAIESLHFCAVQLANGRVCQLSRDPEPTVVTFTDDEKHLSLWFPLLTGLSRAIGHNFDDLRASALENLFRVLALFGSKFSPKLWELIFRRVLLPIFDNIGYSKGRTDSVSNSISAEFSDRNATQVYIVNQMPIYVYNNSKFMAQVEREQENPWLTATCMSAFRSMVEMFTNFIDIINFLLEDMLDLFISCILQDNEYLSRISCSSLVEMLTTNGLKFTNEMWSLICSHFTKAFQNNTPYEIAELASTRGFIISPRTEPSSRSMRNSESTGFNSLPIRLGHADRTSTAASITSSSITSSIASSSSANPTTSSTPPSASLLSASEPQPGTRRRASVAAGSIPPTSPDSKNDSIPVSPSTSSISSSTSATTAAMMSASAPVLPPVSIITSPTTSPLPSPTIAVTTSPKMRPESTPSATQNAKHKLSASTTPRTQSNEELPAPDGRRRAASVAGVTAPVIPAIISNPVTHSTSVPEIQKLELQPSSSPLSPSASNNNIPSLPTVTPPPQTPTSSSTSSIPSYMPSYTPPANTTPSSTSTPTSTPSSTAGATFVFATPAKSERERTKEKDEKGGTMSFLKMGTGTNSPPVVANKDGHGTLSRELHGTLSREKDRDKDGHGTMGRERGEREGYNTLSKDSMANSNSSNSSNNSNVKASDNNARLRSRCIVQLLLIHAVNDIALSQYAYLLTSHLVTLIECLETAYNFSHKTNRDAPLQDYMTKTMAIDLFRKQEIDSISCYLTICFKLYGETKVDAEARINTSEARLIPRIRSILTEFVDHEQPKLIPIIKQILNSLLQLEESQFYKNSGIFYILFTNLMLTDSRDIRVILRDIMQRLGKVKNLSTI